ncbi:hypothetical protein TeGR_g10108 [Tetraparma gracilis]|uniref:Uncharacterized protein n=1 Tax=Tetraparma gracilis TaxID=2962635 RepID=A0ABQ6N5C5_9STRA|nr:hypothetical protein TeGR_g10108 [Tetraparma gracilis]
MHPPLPTPASSASAPPPSPVLHSLLAGGMSGMVAKSVVAPLDRLKILFQVTNTSFSYPGVRAVVSLIIRDEGFPALWKGNGVMMLRVFPYAGIQFCVFDSLKHSLSLPSSPAASLLPTPASQSMVAGSTAGLVSTVATYPLDLCRARLAVMRNSPSSPPPSRPAPSPTFPSIVRSILSASGPRGLYLGIAPTLAGMIPYAGVAFTLNDALRRSARAATGEDATTSQKLAAGGVSGLVAQSLT